MKMLFIQLFIAGLVTAGLSADRYEAESAIVDENSIQLVSDESASGGKYVGMKEGILSFKVTVSEAGFYTLWTGYSQPHDINGKIQNLSVNGSSTGQISFPYTEQFIRLKASAKIKLAAGANTISITKSWGWVNIDYIELTSYEATPFSIPTTLVTPNASENAKKMYNFLRENFQKKIISGVMTNTVMQNDGKYTPNTVENQIEVAWIIEKSNKTPALLGLDFMHGTGKSSDGEWHKGYTNATVSLAEDIFKKGGIPTYCWHWKDPLQTVEAFYSPSSGNSTVTTFNLLNAFTDSIVCNEFNTGSVEYQAIITDLDIVADYLKKLSDKGIPVVWRPMHEASGKWFWWGYKGPKACISLYKLMFDRFVNYHKLDNLIWVWTTDEANNALDWYPGDEFVDILGRDYYYYPREANHGSLVASFEKVKEIFGGKKIISLSENGSIPHPDSLVGDGAGWSYFMPWYGDYTMDGWAHDNTAADWNSIMNHEYVLTLDKMPGWDNYVPSSVLPSVHNDNKRAIAISYGNGYFDVRSKNIGIDAVELYTLQGTRIANSTLVVVKDGVYRFSLAGVARGTYIAHVKSAGFSQGISQTYVVK